MMAPYVDEGKSTAVFIVVAVVQLIDSKVSSNEVRVLKFQILQSLCMSRRRKAVS